MLLSVLRTAAYTGGRRGSHDTVLNATADISDNQLILETPLIGGIFEMLVRSQRISTRDGAPGRSHHTVVRGG